MMITTINLRGLKKGFTSKPNGRKKSEGFALINGKDDFDL